MTSTDDRADALADRLHSASVAAAQLADARDHATSGAFGTPDAAVPCPPILGEAEVQRRVLILAGLQSELDVLGVRAVLARNHKLTLRYNVPGPQPCGMTDPVLHVFGPSGMRKATTDGSCFRIDSGEEFPVDDPAGTATRISDPRVTHGGQPL